MRRNQTKQTGCYVNRGQFPSRLEILAFFGKVLSFLAVASRSTTVTDRGRARAFAYVTQEILDLTACLSLSGLDEIGLSCSDLISYFMELFLSWEKFCAPASAYVTWMRTNL